MPREDNLREQLLEAKHQLDKWRLDGDPGQICFWEERFGELMEKL